MLNEETKQALLDNMYDCRSKEDYLKLIEEIEDLLQRGYVARKLLGLEEEK